MTSWSICCVATNSLSLFFFLAVGHERAWTVSISSPCWALLIVSFQLYIIVTFCGGKMISIGRSWQGFWWGVPSRFLHEREHAHVALPFVWLVATPLVSMWFVAELVGKPNHEQWTQLIIISVKHSRSCLCYLHELWLSVQHWYFKSRVRLFAGFVPVWCI